MKIDDPETREKLQRLASIETRLARHEKTTRLGIMWLTVLALPALVLLAYHVIHL
jgi:hypothetical protein